MIYSRFNEEEIVVRAKVKWKLRSTVGNVMSIVYSLVFKCKYIRLYINMYDITRC